MQNTIPTTDQADPLEQNVSIPYTELEDLAVKLARKLSTCIPRRGSFPIPNELEQFSEFFQSAYHYFDEATKAQVSTSQAAEWLLDNFYVVEQAIRQVEEDLPADYYHRLPKTQDGWTRIYIVTLAITWREGLRFDIEQIRSFIQTFQEITPFSTGELWALPLMLRLTVLEAL